METRKYTCDTGRVPRPATGKTPVRNLRVPGEIWEPALAKARAEDRTITDVIIAALKQYIGVGGESTVNHGSELGADLSRLTSDTLLRLAAKAEEAAGSEWVQQVLSEHPSAPKKQHPHLIVEAALQDGFLSESQIPH